MENVVIQFAIAVLLTILILKVDRFAKKTLAEFKNETKAAFTPVEQKIETKKKEVYDQVVFVRSKAHSFASEIAVSVNLQNVLGIELYQASIPQGKHTLASNETFTIDGSGPAITFTVPAGTYTLSALVAKITSVSPSSVKASYSKTTFLVTITYTSAFTMTISDELGYILGIDASTSSSSGAPYIVTGTKRANLYGPHMCAVKIKELTRLGTTDDVLARVPLKDALTFYQPDSPLNRPFAYPTFVDYLTIRMEDFDTGELMDFNGLEYTLTLNFKVVRYKHLAHDEVLTTS